MKDTEILKVTAELENDSLWACNSDRHVSKKKHVWYIVNGNVLIAAALVYSSWSEIVWSSQGSKRKQADGLQG